MNKKKNHILNTRKFIDAHANDTNKI